MKKGCCKQFQSISYYVKIYAHHANCRVLIKR